MHIKDFRYPYPLSGHLYYTDSKDFPENVRLMQVYAESKEDPNGNELKDTLKDADNKQESR